VVTCALRQAGDAVHCIFCNTNTVVQSEGDDYLEDGIPHLHMRRST